MTGRLLNAARLGSKIFVVAVGVAAVLLAVAQRGGSEGAWTELTRYLPYYWLLPPCVGAFVLACWLGRGWVLASLAAPALVVTVVMGLELNLNPDGSRAGESGTQRVRLMTYNAKLFGGQNSPASLQAVALEVRRHDPDILVMQDVDGLLVERSAPALVGGPPLFGLPHVYALGQYVVASRLPLRHCGPANIDFPGETHRYLRCTVDAHGREFTVVTAHFKSPRMGLLAARREGVEGGSEWQQNFSDRMTQSRALARQLADMPRPLVVAGDLNAPESSPVIQRLLAAGLRDAFSVAGRGYGYSYGQSMRAGLSFLRIDHILVSAGIDVSASFVGEAGPSEHRPVIADLVLRR